MKCFPEYNLNIIVGIQLHNEWAWYVTRKEVWFLDYKKWSDSFGQKNEEEPGERWLDNEYCVYYPVVNQHNASSFLNAIKDYRVKTEELRGCMRFYLECQADHDELLDLSPVLFVDFDEQKLYSCFPEPASYEHFVPDGWKGFYRDFSKYIPEKEKYYNEADPGL